MPEEDSETGVKHMPNPCLSLGHCFVCREGRKMICCECGDALSPWHPDIQHLYTSGEING